MRDEFDHLEHGFMTVTEYEAHFHALSRYSYDSISTESENIQKFVKGLDVFLQLATSQMVVFVASFQSIMDHAKMIEGILQVSQRCTILVSLICHLYLLWYPSGDLN